MPKSYKDIMKRLSPADRKKVERRTQELVEEHMTLQQLRKELRLTQDTMAELLDMKQGNVSKVEKRTDMLISTLRQYIEAMGGSLELVARIPGRKPVRLEGFRDLTP